MTSLHRPDADRLITRTSRHVRVEFERIHPLIAKHRDIFRLRCLIIHGASPWRVQQQQQQSDAWINRSAGTGAVHDAHAPPQMSQLEIIHSK